MGPGFGREIGEALMLGLVIFGVAVALLAGLLGFLAGRFF